MKNIWLKALDLGNVDHMMKNTIMEQIGIKITSYTNDSITGTMPVDNRTHQPYGILHGGASVVLAETLGSLAAHLTVDDSKYQTVGLEVNANHIKPVRSGIVSGIATPIHLGKKTQVWEIKITDESNALICISRLTMAVIEKR
jgi:1,4-dihydroxy-2-naphthoyl-CoA hydrolase